MLSMWIWIFKRTSLFGISWWWTGRVVHFFTRTTFQKNGVVEVIHVLICTNNKILVFFCSVEVRCVTRGNRVLIVLYYRFVEKAQGKSWTNWILFTSKLKKFLFIIFTSLPSLLFFVFFFCQRFSSITSNNIIYQQNWKFF